MRKLVIPLLFLLTIPVFAQANCPVLDEAHFKELSANCVETEESFCFVSHPVSLETADGTIIDVNEAGDLAAINEVSKLSVSTNETDWGLVWGEGLAYPSDSWDALPFTLVVLGDVMLEDAGNESRDLTTLDLSIDIPIGANLRAEPNPDARLITTLFRDDIVKALGRTENNLWVQIQTADGEAGWVIADATNDDFSALPVANDSNSLPVDIYRPWQAFRILPTGSTCQSGGVLLQTSDLDTPIQLEINSIPIQFIGTTFVQYIDEAVRIAVFEGESNIDIEDQIIAVEAGNEIAIPFDPVNDAPNLSEGLPVVEASMIEALNYLPTEYLPRPVFPTIDLSGIITPRPASGESPLDERLVTDPCMITVGPSGVNLRSGPGTNYRIQGAIAFRESALPIARAIGTDDMPWWKLADHVWLRIDTTVTSGDCSAIPFVSPPEPPAQEETSQ